MIPSTLMRRNDFKASDSGFVHRNASERLYFQLFSSLQ